jgi:hypothetical protein
MSSIESPRNTCGRKENCQTGRGGWIKKRVSVKSKNGMGI